MYRQTVLQNRNNNRTQLVFHALNALASKCRVHVLQTSLKTTESCLDAYPSIHVALRITVVSCSTHQQLLKQQLAPWSVTCEVSTSNPSVRVEFLGPDNATTKRDDAISAYAARKEGRKVQNLVMMPPALSTVYTQDTGYGGE